MIRCLRAWTLIQLSPQELLLPNSQTVLHPSSSPGVTVSDQGQGVKGNAARYRSCKVIVCRVLFSQHNQPTNPASAAFSGLQIKSCLVVELQNAVVLSLNLHLITRATRQTDRKCVMIQDIKDILLKAP